MLPINHLKRTLDRCCGQWEFVASDHVPDNRRLTRWSATVRFLNTGLIYDLVWQSGRVPEWDSSIVTGLVSSTDDLFLANRLNELSRDDAGDPIFETPDKML